MTSSPTLTFLTPLPTASTTPARSLPWSEGNVRGPPFGKGTLPDHGLSRVLLVSRLHTDEDLFWSRHRLVDLDDVQDVYSAIFVKLHRTRHEVSPCQVAAITRSHDPEAPLRTSMQENLVNCSQREHIAQRSGQGRCHRDFGMRPDGRRQRYSSR